MPSAALRRAEAIPSAPYPHRFFCSMLATVFTAPCFAKALASGVVREYTPCPVSIWCFREDNMLAPTHRLSRGAVRAFGILLAGAMLAGCGINTIPTLQEQAKAAWSEVLNQYQRRADLIPNLVETVKGYASQESKVLLEVTEARAKATQVQIPPDILTNPEAFQKFQQAQGELTGALS